MTVVEIILVVVMIILAMEKAIVILEANMVLILELEMVLILSPLSQFLEKRKRKRSFLSIFILMMEEIEVCRNRADIFFHWILDDEC